MNAKIRDLTLEKAPCILVVWESEAEAGAVSLRMCGQGDKGQVAIADFLARARNPAEGNAITVRAVVVTSGGTRLNVLWFHLPRLMK